MFDDRPADNEVIAKITSTKLGYEDHGVLTVYLVLDFGGCGQSAGGYVLDSYDKATKKRIPTDHCGRWVAGIIGACGVENWEKVAGRTVIAIRDKAGWGGVVIGIRPLPTEKGVPFMFQSEAPCEKD